MSSSVLFLAGLAITLLTCLAFVIYLRAPLHRILLELCGTSERADFWAAFSTDAFVLVPMIFAMQCIPAAGAGTAAVLEIAAQLGTRPLHHPSSELQHGTHSREDSGMKPWNPGSWNSGAGLPAAGRESRRTTAWK